MRFFFFLFSFLFALHSLAWGQQEATLRQPRILILLDGSSSMTYEWGKAGSNNGSKDAAAITRFQAAAKVVNALIDSVYAVNGAVEFGLRVYGQQFAAQENNCFDTRREVAFSKDNQTQMALRLASITPRGVSPIAYSLQRAAVEDLEDEARNAYAIILITDGGESCGGNICEVAEMLLKKKIFFRPYIISLVDYQPLKAEYSCLGGYMQVARPADIGPAISSIVKDYRPLLNDPTVKSAPPAVVAAPVPAPVTVVKPPPPRPVVAFQPAMAMSTSHYRFLPVALFVKARLNRRPLPVVTFPKEEPAPAPVVVKKDTTAPPERPAPPPPRQPETTTVKIVAAEPAKPLASKPVPAPKPAPAPPAEIDIKIEREDAAQTLVEVFFTDGRGRFYQSTPKLQFTDKSGKVVKQFYRTVDANGNPDPQEMTGGTYRMIITGKKNTKTREVEILPNKMNKLVLKVPNGSLKFSYAGAPNRPVSEFNAIVNRRFAPGPVVHQKASEELEYEPGNYYIELNTLPISRFNTDLDFGGETEILIKEPGFVQIANTNPVGDVQLFHPLGDRYVKFYTIPVTGNVPAQKLMLKPGVYEAHWLPDPKIPYAKEKVVPFEVKSNSITQIELK